jgi:hypothetical protein
MVVLSGMHARVSRFREKADQSNHGKGEDGDIKPPKVSPSDIVGHRATDYSSRLVRLVQEDAQRGSLLTMAEV